LHAQPDVLQYKRQPASHVFFAGFGTVLSHRTHNPCSGNLRNHVNQQF
jgi:hypothetical protein